MDKQTFDNKVKHLNVIGYFHAVDPNKYPSDGIKHVFQIGTGWLYGGYFDAAPNMDLEIADQLINASDLPSYWFDATDDDVLAEINSLLYVACNKPA